MKKSVLSVVFGAALSVPVSAGELSACGDGRGVQTIIASTETGAAVGEGMERGIVIYLRGFAKADDQTIDMPYGGLLVAEPKGERFAVIQDKTISVYSFSGFQRLAKSSAKVLKDQSVKAWRWIDGTDEVAFFAEMVKTNILGDEKSRQAYLLRVNVVKGEGTLLPVELPKGVLSAAFDAKGERIAIGFADGHVQAHSASDGKLLASYRGHDAPWNSLGLAFHPTRNLLASSGGDKLIFYDLNRQQVQSVHQTEGGALLLEFVADGKYLIGGDSRSLSLLDLEGRHLETRQSEEGYESFYVADKLRRVFTAGGDRVCWTTFEKWEKTPYVAGGAPAGGAAPAASDVLYKGVPLSHYIGELKGKDTKAQVEALYVIQEMGPAARAAIPDLTALLSSPEWLVRAGAARALSAMGSDANAAIPALKALQKDKEQAVREAAGVALEKIGKTPTAPKEPAAAPTTAELQFKGKPLSHYIRQFNDKDFTTRLFAFGAIEEIGPAAEAAVPALIDVLDGKEPARKANEPSLKSSAIAALGSIGPAAAPAAGRIGESLKSDNADLRRAAAKALLRLGPAAKDAVPSLIADIGDPVLDIRELVIRTLGTIGPDASAAIPALKAVKKDKKQEEWIRNAADEALEKIEKK